ncbi:hypothetical protein CHH58_16025 [Terribacillus saccharophilus]|uniref:hypothetical protein n=1 Tax=Terribacillus saccharophilus TaxID=361277 RepID=UPI000BA79CD3|nr:hypothetical protein [Terribacillus saccharophilus]PAF35563.1 hypothetical protein CHH58_16025 [Terribacillus saccharophilus]
MSHKSVNFKYKFPEQYNPAYTNGVYGGYSPNGEMILNFYFERQPIPYSEHITVDEEFNVVESVVEPKTHNSNVIRFIESGIIMSHETAKKLHKFLEEEIKSQEKFMKENEDGEL